MVHLAAVFAPPLAFQTRGPRGLSPSVATVLNPLTAYGQFLYLDRGYAFFAPDPGPSHLMAVEIEGDRTYRVPSLDDQWPRLLYHRHFMLAEFLNDSYQPALPKEIGTLVGDQIAPDELRLWRLGRSRYEAILNSMVDHVRSRSSGDRNESPSVRIDRLEHMIPDFVGFADRQILLDVDESYVLLEDIPISIEALTGDQSLLAPTETVPAPTPLRERAATGNRPMPPTGPRDPNARTRP